MTNKPLSQLTSGSAVSSTDLFPDIQTAGAGPVKVTAAQIGDYVLSGSGLTGTLPVARGGTGLNSLTAGYIPYGNGTGAFSNSSTFRFDGVNLGVGAAPTNYGGGYTGFWVQGSTGGVIDLSTAGTRVGTFLNTSTDVTIGSISTVPFIFKTSNVERMRIASDGSVGIGTTSPSGKFTVSGGRSNFVAASDAFAISVGYASIGAYYLGANSANDALLFSHSGGQERMRLDNAGNLGLGVTPSAWSAGKAFEIGSLGTGLSVGYGLGFNVTSNAYYNGAFYYGVNGPSTRHAQLSGEHRWFTAPSGTAGNPITFTQAMTLDASGRLGVGPTSLTYPLETSATGGYWNNSNNWSTTPAAIVVTNKTAGGYDPVFIGQMTDSGGTAKNAFAIGAVGTSSWTAGDNVSQISDMYFAVRNNTGGISERMRINSIGNVGIGTSSPGARLDVYGGAGAVTTTIRAASGQNAFLSVMGNGNAFLSTSFDIIQDSTNAAQIFQRANGPLLFGTNNTERARFNAGAPILCLAGGNTSATGTGIAFPATQSASSDANTLDDYEEGAWTPTLASGTWNLRNATYTKIGRQVTVELWADTFSSTVNIINGLPFVANSYSPGVAHNNSGNAYVARAGASSTDVYLRNYADAAIALNSMGSFLIFTITYSTT